MCRHTRMLKGRVNTGRSQRLLMEARALDRIGLIGERKKKDNKITCDALCNDFNANKNADISYFAFTFIRFSSQHQSPSSLTTSLT